MYHAPMRVNRRHRGFVQAGNLRPEELGVPAARAKELVLMRAWTAVAGEGIARRAPARRIHRGVLEIEVPDEAWARELAGLVPRLAGRLSGRFPALGVKRFRLLVAGEGRKPEARAVPELPPEELEAAAPGEETREADTVGESAPSDEEPSETGQVLDRLEELMESYLDASQKA
jgi:hypothetical protein